MNLDDRGDTPFTYSCRKHKYAIASLLHTLGAVLPESMSLRRPLEQAVANGDKSAVQTLFSFAAAPDVVGDEADRMPLLIVALRSLEWVMDVKLQGEHDFRNPFIEPRNPIGPEDAPTSYHGVMELLLEKGQNPNLTESQGNSALLEALKYEYNAQIIHTLMKFGADPLLHNLSNIGSMHVAGATGYIPFMEMMLAGNVDINQISSTNETPLSLAAANGNEDAVRVLLNQEALSESSKVQYDWLSTSQLYNKIKSKDTANLSNLRYASINLTSSDRNGRTLLHLAAQNGVEEAVSTLISLGADIAAVDHRGNTPLHLAAASDTPSTGVLHLLLTHDADLKKRNSPGKTYGIGRVPQDATALHLAAYAGSQPMVQVVLERAIAYPVDAGIKHDRTGLTKDLLYIDWTSDGCGRTVLMCAVESGDVPTAKYLLEKGADVNVSGGMGSWGFNALNLARKDEMIALIEGAGGEKFDW